MMKWLRKYNRQLLAIVTALILVSWLIGEPLRDFLMPDPARFVIGSAFGAEIRNRDLVGTQATVAILEALEVPWRNPNVFLDAESAPLRVEHWHLLSEEAKRAGMIATESDVDEFLRGQQVAGWRLDGIRNRMQVSLAHIRAAIADYVRIMRLASIATTYAGPSERQIRHVLRDTRDRIQVRIITFRGVDFMDDAYVPPDAELAEQFERYRDVYPQDSPDGFGYKWPRRLRVEVLSVRVADVAEKIVPGDDELRRYYRRNRNQPEYQRHELRAPQTQPTATAAATQPAKPEIVAVPMTFEEARPRIEERMKRETAVRRIREAMERIAAELARPWLGQSPGPDGYKRPPDEVRAPDYLSKACETLARKYAVPLTFRRTELLTAADARREEGLGMAVTVGEARDRLTFAEYAFRVPGFFDAAAAGETAPRLALYQTPDAPLYAPAPDQPMGAFLFRVVETREPASPTSLDEVRERVASDVREQKGLVAAEARARSFYAEARNLGIEAAFAAAPDLSDAKYLGATQPKLVGPFPRRELLSESADRDAYLQSLRSGGPDLRGPFLMEVGGRNEEFVDRCFEMASPAFTPPDVAPSSPTGIEPAASPSTGPARAVHLFALPKIRYWIVAELVDVQPLRQDAVESGAFTQVNTQLYMQRVLAGRLRWFRPDEIEQRVGFVRTRTSEGEQAPVTPMRPEVTPPQF